MIEIRKEKRRVKPLGVPPAWLHLWCSSVCSLISTSFEIKTSEANREPLEFLNDQKTQFH